MLENKKLFKMSKTLCVMNIAGLGSGNLTNLNELMSSCYATIVNAYCSPSAGKLRQNHTKTCGWISQSQRSQNLKSYLNHQGTVSSAFVTKSTPDYLRVHVEVARALNTLNIPVEAIIVFSGKRSLNTAG